MKSSPLSLKVRLLTKKAARIPPDGLILLHTESTILYFSALLFLAECPNRWLWAKKGLFISKKQPNFAIYINAIIDSFAIRQVIAKMVRRNKKISSKS